MLKLADQAPATQQRRRSSSDKMNKMTWVEHGGTFKDDPTGISRGMRPLCSSVSEFSQTVTWAMTGAVDGAAWQVL